ncbi:MAG: DUF421 domain-containing protein [Clostridia bacterium]|nr:DUF421 domain-containing protein [Clostridia bacterium]
MTEISLFEIGGGILLQITLLRTAILYAVVIAVMRVLGKRQVGELEPSELVITILVSELAAIPMQDTGLPLVRGLIPICVLFALGIIVSALSMESPVARRILSGKPSIIISDGKYVQKEIRRQRISVDEISEELRLKGVTDVRKVKYGIIETNGQLSVVGFSEGAGGGLPVSVICNGRLMKENIRLLGKTEGQIEEILKRKNISSERDVFYMSFDEAGRMCIVENED